MERDITFDYSVWTFADDFQIMDLEVQDPNWMSKNLIHLLSCEPVANLIQPLTVEFTSIEQLNSDYLGIGLIELVSEELAMFLEPFVNAEFIQISVLYKNKIANEKKFFVMHLFDQISALDTNRSEFTEYSEEAGGGINRIKKLVLDKASVGVSKAFVISEISLFCVSNELAEKIKMREFRGIRFMPLGTYQNISPRSSD